MSVEQSHGITEILEKELKRGIKGIEEVFIHVEPSRKPRKKEVR
jgi:divalent metal cation (Fe/Co/Zn/Cd) transporter